MKIIGNIFFVAGASDNRVAIQNPPRRILTKNEALEFAAWIVICAGGDFEKFKEVYESVVST